MAGVKVLTDLDAHKALRSAWRAAQNQGYNLTSAGLDIPRFEAKKGHALFRILAGPLAPYCQFRVSVETYASGTEIVLEKNMPWLTTGALGVRRVNRQADELADAIGTALQEDGGKVLEKKEF
jgi:hypothetical protein